MASPQMCRLITPLRVRSTGEAGRKVTWLELFFDLIFVAAVAQVAEPLREQYALDSRSSAGFAAAYAGMRLTLVAQYFRARHVPEARPLTTRYLVGHGAA